MELRFENPYYLVLLLSIPLLIITHFYFLRKTKKKAMKFANFEALKRVTGKKLITKNIPLLVLRLIILALLILSASGPVIWYKGQESHNDFVLAIDTSASMLNEDLSPNRLSSAKESALEFVESLDSRTRVGLVTFAGVSFINSLLTRNLEDIKNKIEKIDITTVGGTDLGTALVTSTNVLLQGKKAKSIILLTDGSQTTGSFVENPVKSGTYYAKNNHVIVYTIGVGTGQGTATYVPLNITAVYDKTTLQYIASETGGKFFEANNEQELKSAFDEIASLKSQAFLDIDLRFGLMMVSLLLLFLEWGLKNTRYRAIP
jgi:Ca-activated chloride channel family protein